MIKLIKVAVWIAIIYGLGSTAYVSWVGNSAVSCAEETMGAVVVYSEAYLAFTEATEMYMDAQGRYNANPTNSLYESALQAHENFMAVLADSREKIAATKAPTCLANVPEETLQEMGGPLVLAASDLHNLPGGVLRYQESLLTYMDSASECHRTYEEAICAKYDADAELLRPIINRIGAIQDKAVPETE